MEMVADPFSASRHKMLNIVDVVGMMLDNLIGIFLLTVDPQSKCINYERW